MPWVESVSAGPAAAWGRGGREPLRVLRLPWPTCIFFPFPFLDVLFRNDSLVPHSARHSPPEGKGMIFTLEIHSHMHTGHTFFFFFYIRHVKS